MIPAGLSTEKTWSDFAISWPKRMEPGKEAVSRKILVEIPSGLVTHFRPHNVGDIVDFQPLGFVEEFALNRFPHSSLSPSHQVCSRASFELFPGDPGAPDEFVKSLTEWVISLEGFKDCKRMGIPFSL
jgi:hypothetical protein